MNGEGPCVKCMFLEGMDVTCLADRPYPTENKRVATQKGRIFPLEYAREKLEHEFERLDSKCKYEQTQACISSEEVPLVSGRCRCWEMYFYSASYVLHIVWHVVVIGDTDPALFDLIYRASAVNKIPRKRKPGTATNKWFQLRHVCDEMDQSFSTHGKLQVAILNPDY